jgi:hypothetical protein
MSSTTKADSRIPRNLAPVEPRSLLAPALVLAGIVGFFGFAGTGGDALDHGFQGLFWDGRSWLIPHGHPLGDALAYRGPKALIIICAVLLILAATVASRSVTIANIDINVLTQMLERLYYYNMRFADDPELKGDVTVIARGAASILAKEAAQVRRNEFLAATANPIDMQIVGIEGRAAILREVAKSLDMEVDRVVPPVDVLQARMAAQAQQEAMMMAQAAPGGGGPSPQGQELQDGSPVTDSFGPTKKANP